MCPSWCVWCACLLLSTLRTVLQRCDAVMMCLFWGRWQHRRWWLASMHAIVLNWILLKFPVDTCRSTPLWIAARQKIMTVDMTEFSMAMLLFWWRFIGSVVLCFGNTFCCYLWSSELEKNTEYVFLFDNDFNWIGCLFLICIRHIIVF